jgi:hypothetical protein
VAVEITLQEFVSCAPDTAAPRVEVSWNYRRECVGGFRLWLGLGFPPPRYGVGAVVARLI